MREFKLIILRLLFFPMMFVVVIIIEAPMWIITGKSVFTIFDNWFDEKIKDLQK